jgi:hypothetical protein
MGVCAGGAFVMARKCTPNDSRLAAGLPQVELHFVMHNRTGNWFFAGVWMAMGFRPSGELLFFAPPKKSSQKKGGPGGLPADAGSLRFSPFRALAELAGFAAPYG